MRRRYDAQTFSELENWEPEDRSGTWVIQNGIYNGQGDRSVTKNTYTDTIIEMDMRTVVPGENPWETAWINFRYTDKLNRYYFLLHAAGGTVTAELSKIVNGTTTTLVRNGVGYVDALAWNRIRIQNIGDNIKIYINGAPFCDLTDSSLVQGKVALEALFSQVHFDNITVTDVGGTGSSTSDDFNVVDNDNPFGNQWKHSYSERLLERADGDVVIERSNGQRHVFEVVPFEDSPSDGVIGQSEDGSYTLAEGDDGGLEVLTEDGTTMRYGFYNKQMDILSVSFLFDESCQRQYKYVRRGRETSVDSPAIWRAISICKL